MVGGASAVILTAGWAAAPSPLEELSPGEDPSTGEEPAAAPTEDVAPDEDPAPDDDATGDSAEQTIDGPVVTNIRGDYQVRLHVVDGEVVDVEFPVAGTEAAESRRVNGMALPVLEERFLEAQSADVE